MGETANPFREAVEQTAADLERKGHTKQEIAAQLLAFDRRETITYLIDEHNSQTVE